MLSEATALVRKSKYELPRLKLTLVTESPASDPSSPYVIRSPEDVADFFEPVRNLSEEHFASLHLNSRHEVIGLHDVSHGTLSASLVHPREVFKAAVLANSHAILICHNHPSGATLTPSAEDLQTTTQLISAGRILGIAVLDHVILSPVHDLYSIRENHPDLWN